MLRSTKELHDYVLEADDGQIGRSRDFLFDDAEWTIRYMVVDTGKWLSKRKVLVTPSSLGEANAESQLFRVRMTRKEIEESPPLDSDAPVSREYERQWHEHYNWAPYWGIGGIPATMPADVPESKSVGRTAVAEETESKGHNLRSVQEVTGYHIEATDGKIGHVKEFIVDDTTWTIRYLVVDTRNWLPGKKVLVAPEWIDRIDWATGRVRVNLTRSHIENGPEFDPSAPVNREYETRLYDYYGRPKYWE